MEAFLNIDTVGASVFPSLNIVALSIRQGTDTWLQGKRVEGNLHHPLSMVPEPQGRERKLPTLLRVGERGKSCTLAANGSWLIGLLTPPFI